MPDPVALRLQRLSQSDQALALARLAQQRGGGTFSPSDIAGVFDGLALPQPSNISAVAGRLKSRGDLTTALEGGYRLTPQGRTKSTELLGSLDQRALAAETAGDRGGEFANSSAVVLPAYLAPPELVASLRPFLGTHPFEANVFGMTRFPEEGEGAPDPVPRAMDTARRSCSEHGLTLHFASDGSIADDLWQNVAAYMWACRYGIGFFEDRQARGLNYNLTIEVGAMIMAGRRTALLKDASIPSLPTDFVGKIYKPVDLDDPASVSGAVHRWIRDDLRLGACPSCP